MTPRANSQDCGICQSRFGDTDCIHVPGAGVVDDPSIPQWNIDPTAGNLVTEGPNGLKGTLPNIYLDPPSAMVRASVDQTIPLAMEWPLLYNREMYDTDNMWDEDEPSKLFFRTRGLYIVTLNVRWLKTGDNSATGFLAAYLRLNSDTLVVDDAMHVPNGDLYPHQSLVAIVPAKADDYVESLVKCAVYDGDDEPMAMRVTAERQSPIMTATFYRSLDGLNIPGY